MPKQIKSNKKNNMKSKISIINENSINMISNTSQENTSLKSTSLEKSTSDEIKNFQKFEFKK